MYDVPLLSAIVFTKSSNEGHIEFLTNRNDSSLRISTSKSRGTYLSAFISKRFPESIYIYIYPESQYMYVVVYTPTFYMAGMVFLLLGCKWITNIDIE